MTRKAKKQQVEFAVTQLSVSVYTDEKACRSAIEFLESLLEEFRKVLKSLMKPPQE